MQGTGAALLLERKVPISTLAAPKFFNDQSGLDHLLIGSRRNLETKQPHHPRKLTIKHPEPLDVDVTDGKVRMRLLKSVQLVPKNDRISLLSLLLEIQKMMTNGGTNSNLHGGEEERVRSILVTISKRYTWRILSYLFENGAITSVIARRRLSIPRRSAFRSLSELEEIGLVELATRAKVPHRDGKPGNVYRLLGAEIEDVRKAVRLHNLLFGSRKYCVADELAQTILEEFNEKGLKDPSYTYAELRTRVKALKIPFSTYDISEMVYTILRENDLNVWK